MTPEGRVKAKLKRQLDIEGYFTYWPVPGGYGRQMVDCLAWRGRPGLVLTALALEVKREGVETPTPRQAAVMRDLRKQGVFTYVVTMRDGELVWLKQV